MTPVLTWWTFWMLLTFTNGDHNRQTYHFPVVADPSMAPETVAALQRAAESKCKEKERERRAWLEIQHRDGLVRGSAVVTCHEEPS